MSRATIPVLAALILLSCGHPLIDAADREATVAWKDLTQAYRAEAAIAAAFAERLREAAPAEHVAVGTLTQAAEELSLAERVAPTDPEAVQDLERRHRIIEAQSKQVEHHRRKYPALGNDADFTGAARLLEETCRGTAAVLDRYNEAAIAYNRALRTFPESVINNMFLKRDTRAVLRLDRGQNARPARSP